MKIIIVFVTSLEIPKNLLTTHNIRGNSQYFLRNSKTWHRQNNKQELIIQTEIPVKQSSFNEQVFAQFVFYCSPHSFSHVSLKIYYWK